MRRLIQVVLVVLVAGAIAAPTAWAGSPHFVSNTVEASRTGNTPTISDACDTVVSCNPRN